MHDSHNDRLIADLAALVGAERQAPLHPAEVVAFTLRTTGSLIVDLANGERVNVAGRGAVRTGDVKIDAALADGLVNVLRKYIAGDQIARGKTYVRRTITIADGTRMTIFTEAGRA